VNPGEQETPEEQVPSSYGTPPPPLIGPPGPIQWNLLFRLASPLAVITGVVSYLVFPVGLLLVLPFSLKRIIARYRPLHTGALLPGRGAAIGAFMALLSFIGFLVFFLATLSLYRAEMLDKFHHDYLLDEGKPVWYPLLMVEINITVSSVYVVPAVRFSPATSAKAHFSALALVSASAFSAMDSLLSLEAF